MWRSSSPRRCTPRAHESQELKEESPGIQTLAPRCSGERQQRSQKESSPRRKSHRPRFKKAGRTRRRKQVRATLQSLVSSLPPLLSSCSASSAGKLSSFQPAAPASSGYTWFPPTQAGTHTHTLRLSAPASLVFPLLPLLQR